MEIGNTSSNTRSIVINTVMKIMDYVKIVVQTFTDQSLLITVVSIPLISLTT